MGVTRQAASQLLQEIETRGLVTRVQDPSDKRGVIAMFTGRSEGKVGARLMCVYSTCVALGDVHSPVGYRPRAGAPCDGFVHSRMLDPMVTTKEDVILAFPGPIESIAPATEFRSTWLASSLEGLRGHRHFDRYLSLLSGHHDEILNAVAAAWIPLAIARAHYEACELLALNADEIEAMARDAGSIRRQWYSTIIATAQRGDTTIWTMLSQLHKYWLRSANGGAVAVFRLGPNRARVDYVRCGLFEIRYFREASRVVLLLLLEHLCDDAKVVVRSSARVLDGVEYQLSWSATRSGPIKPID
jgi:MarR family